MDPTRLMTSTATVTFATATGPADQMGNPTDVETTASYRCWLWQVGRSENTVNADVRQEAFNAGFDPTMADADLDTVKSVAIDGVSYQFDGPPWAALNPRTQQVTHVEATLRRTR